MGTFESPINAVTAQTLEQLRDDKIKEGLQLEYKEFLPSEKTRDKFLSSVTAFANSSGGDLIYGVRAKRDDDDAHTGEIEAIVGLPKTNFDLETQRMQNWIRTCIEPPLSVLMEPIDRGSEPPCLLLRVPKSWTSPHMVKTMGNPFYRRNSASKYQLSANELRQAFILSATARDRVREFRKERIAQIERGETPTQTGPGAKLVLHCLPLTPDEAAWIRFREAQGDKARTAIGLQIGLLDNNSLTWHYNTDGFLISSIGTNRSYTQVFRDCGIESVDITLEGHKSADRVPPTTWGINIERKIINALRRYQSVWISVGVAGPIALSVTLMGVKGWMIVPGHFANAGTCIDRDCVITGDVTIEDFTADVGIILKPLFDFIWNSSGYPESPHYHTSRWVDPTVKRR